MPRLVLLLVLVLVAFAPTGYTNSTDPKSAVEQVLQTQQEAWNRHDLDAFMAGYWNSPDLTFFSDAKETSGWQATLDRYRTTYAGPGHSFTLTGILSDNVWRDCSPQQAEAPTLTAQQRRPH